MFPSRILEIWRNCSLFVTPCWLYLYQKPQVMEPSQSDIKLGNFGTHSANFTTTLPIMADSYRAQFWYLFCLTRTLVGDLQNIGIQYLSLRPSLLLRDLFIFFCRVSQLIFETVWPFLGSIFPRQTTTRGTRTEINLADWPITGGRGL